MDELMNKLDRLKVKKDEVKTRMDELINEHYGLELNLLYLEAERDQLKDEVRYLKEGKDLRIDLDDLDDLDDLIDLDDFDDLCDLIDLDDLDDLD